MSDSSGNDYYYLHDHLFSPAVLVEDNGTVVERYEYDAYGACRILEPNFAPDPDGLSDYANCYLFTGRRLDILAANSLKIRHERNRYYDPETGRWLTHDPLGIMPDSYRSNAFRVITQYTNGLNLYEFVKSNPLVATDPFGLAVDTRGNAPRGTGNIISPYEAVRRTMFSERFEKVRIRREWERKFGEDWPHDPIFWVDPPNRMVLEELWKQEFEPHSTNGFVFTCKRGWLDLGHFFQIAYWAYYEGLERAKRRGIEIEKWQQWRGDLWSAWSPEDLPSNELGAQFGVLLSQWAEDVESQVLDLSFVTHKFHLLLASIHPPKIERNLHCPEHVMRAILKRDVDWWVVGGQLRPELRKIGHDPGEAIEFMKVGTDIQGIGHMGGLAHSCFCDGDVQKEGYEWP